jgi:2'-5' RNA ligase
MPELERAFWNTLSNTMLTYESFTIKRGNFDVYGHSKKMDLIERGVGNLEKLHHEIGETILHFAGVLNPSPEGQVFQQHVTRVAGRQMPKSVTINAVQLVHRQADGKKLIGHRYPFGNRKKI